MMMIEDNDDDDNYSLWLLCCLLFVDAFSSSFPFILYLLSYSK